MMGSLFCSQYRAILLKDLRLFSRNRRDAAREIGIPIVLLLALVLIANYGVSSTGAIASYPTDSLPTRLIDGISSYSAGSEVWFAPCSIGRGDFSSLIAAAFEGESGGLPTRCFNSSADMIAAYTWPSMLYSTIAAVNFTAPPSVTSTPFFSYTIYTAADVFAPGAGSFFSTPSLSNSGLPIAPSAIPYGAYRPLLLPLQITLERAASLVLFGAATQSPTVACNSSSSSAAATSACSTPDFDSFDWSLRQFPSLPYDSGLVRDALALVIPIFLTFIFTLQVRVALVSLLEEKERRLTIAMRQMGLTSTVWWLGSATSMLLKNLAVITLVAAVASGLGLLPRVEFSLVLIVFYLFELSVIGFSIAASTLFTKSTTGGVIGMAIYLALALPSYAFLTGSISSSPKIFLSLLAPFAFNLALNELTHASNAHESIGWTTLSSPEAALPFSTSTATNGSVGGGPGGVSLAALLGMLALDAVLYLFLAWYCEAVIPQEFSVPLHPCFCLGFKKSARVGKGSGTGPSSYSSSSSQTAAVSTVAAATDVSSSGVVLRGLTKIYTVKKVAKSRNSFLSRLCQTVFACGACRLQVAPSVEAAASSAGAALLPGRVEDAPRPSNEHVAVDSIDFTFKEGNITCLLGHNGAGKTTTLSMLTGLTRPTSGDGFIYGHSIISDMDGVIKLLGVCPQENSLWPLLTVREHLQLFGEIRGISGARLEAKIDKLLSGLGLSEKGHSMARTLSGGQMRRVCLAMALIGDSKVLVLDEVTSGLDPASRRQVWKFLQEYKKGRVIIFCTHFMDEAEILGDEICILSQARVQAHGTPLSLKSTFGIGYHLVAEVMLPIDEEKATPSASHPFQPRDKEARGKVDDSEEAVSLRQTAAMSASASLVALVQQYIPKAVLEAPPNIAQSANSLHTDSLEMSNPSSSSLPSSPSPSSSYVAEVQILLPRDSCASFPPLFQALQALKDRTGAEAGTRSIGSLLGYSLKSSSLEDVFLSLPRADGDKVDEHETTLDSSPFSSSSASSSSSSSSSSLVQDPSFSPRRNVEARSSLDPNDWLRPTEDLAQNGAHGSAVVRGDGKRRQCCCSSEDFRRIMTQLWRRKTETLRTPRIIWLQIVTPIIFVALGMILVLLRNVGGSAPASAAIFTPSIQFSSIIRASKDPLKIASFVVPTATSNGSDAVLSSLASNFTVFGRGNGGFLNGTWTVNPTSSLSISSDDFSAQILSTDGLNASYPSPFAVMFDKGLDPPSQNASTQPRYSYTVFYNTTITNALPLAVSLLDSSFLRYRLLQSGINISASTRSAVASGASLFESSFLPFQYTTGGEETTLGNYLTLSLLAFIIVTGFNTIPAVQAYQAVLERETKTKQLQIVMGLSHASYWFSRWLWDAIQFIVVGVLSMGIVYIGTHHDYRHNNFFVICILTGLFGLSIPGPAYVASFFFDSAPAAQMYVRLGFSTVTILLFFASFGLEYPGVRESLPGVLGPLALFVRYIGLIFPPYALARGIADVGIKSDCNSDYESVGLLAECRTSLPFSWGIGGANILYMIASIPICFALIMLLEDRAFYGHCVLCSKSACMPTQATLPTPSVSGVGFDVAFEAARSVEALSTSLPNASSTSAASFSSSSASSSSSSASSVSKEDGGLIVSSLRKVFRVKQPRRRGGGARQQQQQQQQQQQGNEKVAVADLSLAISNGECFGLLGVNGAGKTTTLSILVGESAPSSGRIAIAGAELHPSSFAAMLSMLCGPNDAASSAAGGRSRSIGYCPQFDALFERLTGTEVLEYYASLGGLCFPDPASSAQIRAALEAVDLVRHADMQTRFYSLGTKRRLSLAIAYIMRPRFVLLDECTTGVDPAARQRMNALIRRAMPGRTTIMTTHVLENADALCTRIGVMAEGRLACIGTPVNLKRRFGGGYIIEVTTKMNDIASHSGMSSAPAAQSSAQSSGVGEALQGLFLREGAVQQGACTLLESNSGHHSFEASHVDLGKIFAALERAREDQSYRVVDYSISQTTLERAFLKIAAMK